MVSIPEVSEQLHQNKQPTTLIDEGLPFQFLLNERHAVCRLQASQTFLPASIGFPPAAWRFARQMAVTGVALGLVNSFGSGVLHERAYRRASASSALT